MLTTLPRLLQISPLAAGWAKVQEIRRHLAFFRESGKYTMVYMAQVRHFPFLEQTCKQTCIEDAVYAGLV